MDVACCPSSRSARRWPWPPRAASAPEAAGVAAGRRRPVAPAGRPPRPRRQAAAWMPSSPRPRRRARSTSSRCRRDWANYGAILKAFTDKYGIKINSANPDGSSQDEINAVKQLGNQDRAPDVLDVGQSFANGNTALFAPYKVATWDYIPAANKDAERRLGQRLRRLRLDRLQHQDRPELPHDVRRPAQARVQGPGRAQRRPDPGGVGVRGRVGGRPRQRRQPRQHPARASTSGARSRRRATC